MTIPENANKSNSRQFRSDLHRAAIEYASDNYPIFICNPNSKDPATGQGFKNATVDLDIIDSWFDERPDWNIATEPERSGLAVVEIEPSGLPQLPEFCDGHELPRTFTNRSPRGGEHRFYSGSVQSLVRPFVRLDGTKFEIDTRGKGGYVLLPPSRTPDGEYETIDDGAVTDLPQWVAEKIAARKDHQPQSAPEDVEFDLPQNIRIAEHFLARFPVPVEGERNDKTYKAACKLKDLGCSPQTILAMLLKWAPLSDDFTEEEVEGRVISAFANGQNAPGCKALLPSNVQFANVVANVAEATALAKITAANASRQPVKFLSTVSDMLAWPDPTELVEAILVDGELVCHFGPPKSGKSFTAIALALSIASGVPVFGKYKILRPGPVVYLSGEGHQGMKRRMRAWGAAHGLSDDELAALPFYYRTSVPNTRDAANEAIAYVEGIRSALSRSPVLVIIDTMARTLGGMDEDASGDATLFLDMVQYMRDRLSTTMWCIGHTGKDASKGIRGSSNFAAGFDTMLLQTRDEKTGLMYLGTDVAKDAEPFGPLELKLESVPLGEGEKPGYSLELTGGEGAERPAVTAAQETASLRKLLEQFMRDTGRVGFKRGLQTSDMADAYTAHIFGPCPPVGDDGAHMAWLTHRNQTKKKLDNGMRVRNRSKLALLTGLFHEHALPGSTENTIFWHLEE